MLDRLAQACRNAERGHRAAALAARDAEARATFLRRARERAAMLRELEALSWELASERTGRPADRGEPLDPAGAEAEAERAYVEALADPDLPVRARLLFERHIYRIRDARSALRAMPGPR
ncbi:MAG: hypothetical protein HQL41_00485 [Alphaproteobacteria bacterium]|nr:hypothetical protein [Alphaproteobacteria bacterium]